MLNSIKADAEGKSGANGKDSGRRREGEYL